MSSLLEYLRAEAGSALFARVAGPEGTKRRDRIHGTPGPRWFPEGSAIQTVHADASMFVGGIRALLLQSLHPGAMAGVAEHSGYQGDPWGRLQRTSHFLAVTTFGTAADAETMCAMVRDIHSRVVGVRDDGTPYAASDPHLLRWVHIAEIDSFLAAYRRYGGTRLTPEQADAYVAETGRVAAELGATDVPQTVAELDACMAAYRPELRATPAARATARFLLLNPPLPLIARLPYGALAGPAVNLLPEWARRELWLPRIPLLEDPVSLISGSLATRAIRWAMAPTTGAEVLPRPESSAA